MRTALLLAATVAVMACGSDNPSSPPVLTVGLTAPKVTIAVGEPVQLTATARDVNGVTVTDAKFTYTSSAPTIVNVNGDGRIIGVAAGSASITATSGGIVSPPLAIAVTATSGVAVVTMTNNTFTPFTTTIKVGQTVAFDFPPLAHNVIFANRTGKPADIAATQSVTVSRVFGTAGTFPFDCTLHPGMSGQVIVNP
jgi:plastocyanin